jgi:hypothetical protein
MHKATPALILCIFFTSCASTKIYYPPSLVEGNDGHIHAQSMPAIVESGIDRLVARDVDVSASGVHIHEHDPVQNWPTKRTLVVDRKTGAVIGINEEPILASNASNTTNTIQNVWSGFAKTLIGSAASVISLLGLGAQAVQSTGIAASVSKNSANNETARQAITSRAATEQLRILHP